MSGIWAEALRWLILGIVYGILGYWKNNWEGFNKNKFFIAVCTGFTAGVVGSTMGADFTKLWDWIGGLGLATVLNNLFKGLTRLNAVPAKK